MGQQHSIALGVKSRMALAAMLAGAMVSGVSLAGTPDAATATATASQQVNVAQLQQEIELLKGQVAQLKAKSDSNWLTQERTQQITQIVNSVLKDSKTRSQYLDNELQAGYDNGFFIRTADKNFQLTINGYMQFRYMYQDAMKGNNNNAPSSSGAPGGPYSGPLGNSSEFQNRRTRLILSGNAFKNIIYSISGDFAGGSGSTFQILDTWGGYEFNPGFMIRAGSMLVPFTHVEYYSAGTEFPEFAACEAPFDPVRALAFDVSGNVDNNKLFYDVQVNNGSKSNAIQNDGGASSSSFGGLDNRFGFYGRVQFAGAGNNGDFTDSPDLSWHKHLVWAIGGALGYEEQNSTPGTYPQGQSSLQIAGLASPSSGFLSPIDASGSLYRATVDGHLKYRGFAFNSAVFFQRYNAATPGNSSSDTAYFNNVYNTASVWQLGAYGEVGYFVVPHRWEVVGRIGDLTTDGKGKQSMEYAAGVNYYIFGENAKIQGAVTYLPNAAYTSPNVGSTINTSDVVGQLELQVKF